MTVAVSSVKPDAPSTCFTDFVLWMLAQLRYEVSAEGNSYSCPVPEADRAAFGGQDTLHFRFAEIATSPANGANGTPGAEAAASSTSNGETNGAVVLSPETPLFRQLLRKLQAAGRAVHAQPRDQLRSVHEITQRLFPAYQVAGGKIHLAGCSLEDRPYLRLTYLRTGRRKEDAGSGPILFHCYSTTMGAAVSEDESQQLGLADLIPYTPQLSRTQLAEIEQLVAATQAGLTQPQSTSAERGECLATAIVWCKYAQGKLCVTIGEAVAEFPFNGWTRTLQPQPLTCPQTGVPTKSFAATHEGLIAAAEQIARCCETGQRVLRKDLLTCAVSGKLALRERMEICPVCEEPVLRSVLIECPVCHQHVSPDALTHGICRACAAPPRVTKNDARLARLLGEFPGLDEWKSWKLSETATVYIAQARSYFRRLLLVVDKQTLEVQHMASAKFLARKWTPLSPDEFEGQLR